MSEQAPKRDNPYEKKKGMKSITIELSGETTELHQNNTAVWLHEGQEDGDHIFVAHDKYDDGTVLGSFIWRRTMKDQGIGDQFDELCEALGHLGITPNIQGLLDDADLDRYYAKFEEYPDVKDVIWRELSTRQDKYASQMGKSMSLLLAVQPDLFWEHMTDETPGPRPYPETWT